MYQLFQDSRRARFRIYGENDHKKAKRTWNLLDELMYQIPGKDNHEANITDTFYMHPGNQKPLNLGFYHRR